MSTIPIRSLRLACDLGRPNAALDPRTNLSPIALRGADLLLQLAAFRDGAIVSDVSNFDSLTAILRAVNDDGSFGAVVFSEAIAGAALTACTQDAWDAATGQHASISISGDDLNIAAGRYKLSVYGITSATPSVLVPWASTVFTINDVGLVDGTPPDPADQYYTKTEADALFLKLAPAAGAYRVKTYGDGSVFLQLKDSATGKFRSFWLENGVEVYGPEEV